MLDGSKNLFGLHAPSVFIDPLADNNEKYKAIFLGKVTRDEFALYKKERPGIVDLFATRNDKNQIICLCGATSRDGFDWKVIEKPLLMQSCDTQNVAYYDVIRKKYVAYLRTLYGSVRCIGRSESDTFLDFPPPENIMIPDLSLHRTEQWYTNAKTLIPGTVDHHLMFPALFRTQEDSTDIYMVSSADGINWTILPGGPVLSPGNEYDVGCLFAGINLLEISDGDFILPYVGFNLPHKYPRANLKSYVCLAKWAHGRISAVEAFEKGTFSTVQIVLDKPISHVKLNHQTKPTGNILVELADKDGNIVPGRTFSDCDILTGDYPEKIVTWKGNPDVNIRAGEPVRLRLQMKQSKIFSLHFE